MRVRFYTQADCHLCREAAALLRRLGERYPFELEVFLVSDDERMMARYGQRVPVVGVGDQTLDAETLTPALLERLLSPARRGGDGLNGHDHP